MENKIITPAPENTQQEAHPDSAAFPAPKKGFRGFLKKLSRLSWKAWLIIAVVTAILIGGGLFLYDQLTNTYTTPLDRYMDYLNSRSYSIHSEIATLNGFAEAEFNLFGICANLSNDSLDTEEDMFAELVSYREERYGKDYKFYYKIDRKSKLEHDEINDFEDSLKDRADSLKNRLKTVYNEEFLTALYDLDEQKLEEFANAENITLIQAKLYVGALKNLCNELRDADVTEGYELKVTVIVKGSKLDKPEKTEHTWHVYKINGRWVFDGALENIFSHFNLL